jgi:hypothetical protein
LYGEVGTFFMWEKREEMFTAQHCSRAQESSLKEERRAEESSFLSIPSHSKGVLMDTAQRGSFLLEHSLCPHHFLVLKNFTNREQRAVETSWHVPSDCL